MSIKLIYWLCNILHLLQLVNAQHIKNAKSETSLANVDIAKLTKREQFLFYLQENLYHLVKNTTRAAKDIAIKVLADPYVDIEKDNTKMQKYIKVLKKTIDLVERSDASLQNVTAQNSCFNAGPECCAKDPFQNMVNIYREYQYGEVTKENTIILAALLNYGFASLMNNYVQGVMTFLKTTSDDMEAYIESLTTERQRIQDADLIAWHDEFKNEPNMTRTSELFVELVQKHSNKKCPKRS